MANDSELEISAALPGNDDPLQKKAAAMYRLLWEVKTGTAAAAGFPENGVDRGTLFSLTAPHLYEAEAIGRNKVCHSSSLVF